MPKYSPKFHWTGPIVIRRAKCQDCPWDRPGGTLATVRAHVEFSGGHTVVLDVTSRTVIGLRVRAEVVADAG